MTVERTESALDRLADLFVNSDLSAQKQIEETVEAINSALSENPQDLGE